MTAFNQLLTTRTGDVGEEIVHRYLASQGYIPFNQALPGSYPFDCMIYSLHAARAAIVEVKTYPRRYAYDDTGIDLADWNKYQAIAAKNPIAFGLLFVDKVEQAIYGTELRKLQIDRQCTGPTGPKVCFNLSRMNVYQRLTPAELSAIPDPPDKGFDWSRYANLRPYFPQPASLTI